MRDQILIIHADAGVGDSENRVFGVEFEIDARIERQGSIRIISQRQMTKLIQRIGGVRNEFTQEDLRMRIERMDDELQQLIDFGLKFTFRHGYLSPIDRKSTR